MIAAGADAEGVARAGVGRRRAKGAHQRLAPRVPEHDAITLGRQPITRDEPQVAVLEAGQRPRTSRSSTAAYDSVHAALSVGSPSFQSTSDSAAAACSTLAYGAAGATIVSGVVGKRRGAVAGASSTRKAAAQETRRDAARLRDLTSPTTMAPLDDVPNTSLLSRPHRAAPRRARGCDRVGAARDARELRAERFIRDRSGRARGGAYTEAFSRSTAALVWPGATRAFQITPAGDLYDGAWTVRIQPREARTGAIAAAPRVIAFEDRWLPVAHWLRRGDDIRWSFEAFAWPADGDTNLYVSLLVRADNETAERRARAARADAGAAGFHRRVPRVGRSRGSGGERAPRGVGGRRIVARRWRASCPARGRERTRGRSPSTGRCRRTVAASSAWC